MCNIYVLIIYDIFRLISEVWLTTRPLPQFFHVSIYYNTHQIGTYGVEVGELSLTKGLQEATKSEMHMTAICTQPHGLMRSEVQNSALSPICLEAESI